MAWNFSATTLSRVYARNRGDGRSWIVRKPLHRSDHTLEYLAPQPAQVALDAALEENIMHSGAAFSENLQGS